MLDAVLLVRLFVIALGSYLIGAVPTAYLVCRLHHINIFDVGSGNMGATNVSRALGLGWGLFVWVFDTAKGALAILLATWLWPVNPATASTLAAVAVVIGHNWSVFIALVTGRLRGGKGASTAFGTLLMLAPTNLSLVICVLGLFIIALTRYVSLAVLAMFGVAALWLVVLVVQDSLALAYLFYALTLAGLIVWRFRENIQKLLAGTERRLGERVSHRANA